MSWPNLFPCNCNTIFFLWRCGPTRAMASSFTRFLDHTTTQHSRWDSSGRVIGSSQRPLPDNRKHTQQTNIHAPCGFRTHDLSRRAALDVLLRPRGHWDLHGNAVPVLNGDRGSTVVKVLCYKSEGRRFDSKWCHWNSSLA